MGSFMSKRQNPDRSPCFKGINGQLEHDKGSTTGYKMLVLGTCDAGKSTIVKQMKIIYLGGFTEDELVAYRPIIYKNMIHSAHTLVCAMSDAGVVCEKPANRIHAAKIRDFQLNPSLVYSLSDNIALSVHEVWKDPVVEGFLALHGSEFYLIDSARYFFSEAVRIGGSEYLPSEMDVLRARTKTTGLAETRFTMCSSESSTICLFDVGGQRSERKKWIHCFESVDYIIFCAALSEYDQVLLEEKSQNRLNESLFLFECIVNSRWFSRTSIILLLNKVDIFSEKFPRVPLAKYFPEYKGGDDINNAVKYILFRFMQGNRARLSVYPHLTQATDTSNIRLVFAAIEDTILRNALKDSSIL